VTDRDVMLGSIVADPESAPVVADWLDEQGEHEFAAILRSGEWIPVLCGYGYGNGDGDGNGYGYGNGDGDGDGYGDGDGDGYGYGYGDGYGNGQEE
jgi:hypothetical protein